MSNKKFLNWALILIGFLTIVLILMEGLDLWPAPGDPIVGGNPWLPFIDLSYVLLSQSYIWGIMLIGMGLSLGLVVKFMNLKK